MTAGDPFGLDALEVAELRTRPGAKWHRHPDRIAAWVADMDFPPPPVVIDRLRAVVDRGDVGYPDWLPYGTSPLQRVFAERMQERFGWDIGVDRIHELNDVIQGVRVAIHHLTRPGDGVALHVPSYPPFLASIEDAGRRLVEIPACEGTTGWEFDHDELDDRLKREPAKVLLLCHPHNPTGHVFTVSELRHLADIAMRHDLVVISDEIHAELVYAPAAHVPFAALAPDVEARTVTITSASKAFNLAGLRWAVMHVGDDRFRGALDVLPDHYLGAPNLMAVEATLAAWRDGDEWQHAVLALLDANRQLLADLLAAHLPDVGYHVPAATYLAWLDCRRLGLDDPVRTFQQRGVELSPGPTFGRHGEGFVRLNFATSSGVLERIVAAMAGHAT